MVRYDRERLKLDYASKEQYAVCATQSMERSLVC